MRDAIFPTRERENGLCRGFFSEKAVFPFSRGKNRISQGVENRGSLISVPLALRVVHTLSKPSVVFFLCQVFFSRGDWKHALTFMRSLAKAGEDSRSLAKVGEPETQQTPDLPHSGKKKRAQRLSFWVRRPPGGVGGLPREGVVAENFALETLSSLGFEERNPGCPGNFAGMSRTPGGVQKVCAKNFVRIFRSLLTFTRVPAKAQLLRTTLQLRHEADTPRVHLLEAQPKGPFRAKNATAPEFMVFCYCRRFSLSVPFSCVRNRQPQKSDNQRKNEKRSKTSENRRKKMRDSQSKNDPPPFLAPRTPPFPPPSKKKIENIQSVHQGFQYPNQRFLGRFSCSPKPCMGSKIGERYDWTTGAPHDGNEWKKCRVVPRAHPSRTLLYAHFNRSGSKRGFSFPRATWDRFRCTVEPLPSHNRCRQEHWATVVSGEAEKDRFFFGVFFWPFSSGHISKGPSRTKNTTLTGLSFHSACSGLPRTTPQIYQGFVLTAEPTKTLKNPEKMPK